LTYLRKLLQTRFSKTIQWQKICFMLTHKQTKEETGKKRPKFFSPIRCSVLMKHKFSREIFEISPKISLYVV